MNYKRANRAFLYMVLASMAFSVVYTVIYSHWGLDMSVTLNNFFSEAVVLVPVLLVVLVSRDSFKEVIPLKKIHVSSGLLSALYGVILLPLATFASMVSMLVVKNHITGMTSQIVSMPMWQILLSVGVFGPFVEEIIFRGVFLSSYKKSGRIVASILLSSVLFGIIHMNYSQFIYGMLMGIMLALLVEATGSVWASFIAHGIFNSVEVIMMYVSSDALGETEELMTMLDANESTLASIGIYFVAAVICTAIAICIAYKIARIEGKQENLEGIFKKRTGGRLISVPLIIGIILAVGYMTAVEILTRYI